MSNAERVPFATTIKVRDTCICLHAQRAARAIARRFDEAFRHLDLTNGQFSLLMALNRPEPAGVSAVSSLLAMDRTTLTAYLKLLERRGLVTVAPGAADRRQRFMSLTPAGQALLVEAVPIWEETHAALERGLPGGDGESLRAGLRVLSGSDK